MIPSLWYFVQALNGASYAEYYSTVTHVLFPQYNYKHTHVMDKGKHIGAQSVSDDPYLLHCLQAGRLASDQEYRKDALTVSGQYHLNQDMIHLVTAKNAQALASDQDYRRRLHEYTVLPDDMKVKWAKKAYDLQSEVSQGDVGGGKHWEENPDAY